MRSLFSLLLAIAFTVSLSAQSNLGYYRYPALRGSTVVFTAEGDLWAVSSDGGIARRLTSNPGVEAFAAISPDGSTVAFSGEYEGATDVYTMPLAGGIPVRHTWVANARVTGWTQDGKILYTTNHFSTLPDPRLVLLDPVSGRSEILPLNQASDGTYDDAGTTLFFTRLGFQGSHTKRYKGGTAQKVWKDTAGMPEAMPLTSDFDGTSKTPLWSGGRIVFASDRDGTMNLWSMGPAGGDVRQLTKHRGWDVKSPALDAGRVVYQLGADIHLFDIASGTDRTIPITLASDFDQLRPRWVKSPMDYLSSFAISPTGDRIVLTVRGQIFVAPVEQGRFVRVTSDDRVRHRTAVFTPDGKRILALSDATGETEFVTYPANGAGEMQTLTRDATVLRWRGEPSPDGRWVAWTDKNEEIWLLDSTSRTSARILRTDEGGPGELAWSPDSKWLAYSRSAKNFFNIITLYNVGTGVSTDITSDRVDCFHPSWSTDGKWLYFLSDRVFQSLVPSPWGARQPEPFFEKTRKLYALALTAGPRFPFLPADELAPSADKADEKKEEKKEESKGDEKRAEKNAVHVKVDLAGLPERIYEVPIPAGTYGTVVATEKFLYLTESPGMYQPKTNLVAVEIKRKDVSAKTVLEDIRGFELSRDGKKIAVRKGSDLYVIDANGNVPGEIGKSKVDLGNWTLLVDPREEFRQMFTESWRLERDYFYDPGLHGVDRKALFDRHAPLVARVTDRDELNDLISSLVSELSALHTFVYGGDARRAQERATIASLGTQLTRDDRSGGYRIDHIYKGDPDYPDVASPLRKPGLDIHEGDILLAVNGTPTLKADGPDALLRNLAGQQTLIRIRSAATRKEFDAIVTPMAAGDEDNLRYTEWEVTRRTRVEAEGKGDLGYVHLRAMGGNNYTEWAKSFYPVFDRKGLIVDVRHNRGGNIDSWVLEKLLRKAWFYWQGRVGKPTWNMQHAFRGHIVVLCDENTMSDGEAFTEGFRQLGLGKVIGTRTWGGEIWLSSSNVLLDRGIATAAENGVFGPGGNWLIEGHGVDPDIVVDNLPHATATGEDAQLAAAIRYLQQLIKDKPVEPPKPPAYPDKSFKYE